MKNNKGFTLLELLVVVAIIGLISSIAFVAMQNARAEARDAKRLADVHAIRNALELYYHDNGSYPDPWCIGLTSVAGCNSFVEPNSWIPSLIPKYMQTLPNDPLNTTNDETNEHYLYFYTRWAVDENAPQQYYLIYRRETKGQVRECPVLWGGNWSSLCGGII
ncbi:MAG: prepilin-type N-terminal cleavage/methylation domain-containing protein [Patescibacteria group bacterium]